MGSRQEGRPAVSDSIEASMMKRLGELNKEVAALKSEVERLKDYLNKMSNTPEGVDYVEVDVGFWTKHGSRLPSSYKAFWSNDKGWNAAKEGKQP